MLRITPSTSTKGAKRYFDESLIRGDYYLEGQEIAGNWGGKAADRLGLAGEVDRTAFHRLCENLDPATGERLTARTRDGRRVGYDFTFNCPKHVSAVWALTKDDRILAAFRASVQETMQELEQDCECRVRDNGQFDSRTTGNMVWGEFTHFTSRPVDNVPDPQLHAHCMAFNATYDAEHPNRDGSNGMWKAGDFGSIKRDARYFEAGFHARLSGRMAEMGYAIKRDGKGFWDIANIPGSVREKFSRRTAEIEQLAKSLGITDPAKKAQLGKRTARAKAEGTSMEDLRMTWDSWLSPEERKAITKAQSAADGTAQIVKVTAADALTHAVDHLYERQSVVSDRQLAEQGLRRGFGAVSVPAMWQRIEGLEETGTLLTAERDGRRMVTTREVLAEERTMLNFAKQGRGACAALGKSDYAFKNSLFLSPDADTAEQEQAIRQVLGSHDRVIDVRGGAGTGKTTLMDEVAAGLREEGHQIHAFAPTAEASRGVLREAGFDNADTVAQLFQNREMQQQIRGHVIWIDEAGLLGARDLNRVFKIAETQGCRVILTGDTKQHAPVVRGDALRILETNGAVAPIDLTRIQRQRVHQRPEPEDITRYRQAIKSLSEGNPEQGFATLEQIKAVTEFDSDQDLKKRCEQIAGDYLEALKGKNLKGEHNSVLAVSPTHIEGEAVTQGIREGLKQDGKLAAKDSTVSRLVNRGLTEAERQDAASYAAGQIIQLHQHIKGGFKRGERYTVVDDSEGTPLGSGDSLEPRLTAKASRPERETIKNLLRVKSEDGQIRELPLKHAKRFSVYEKRKLSIAKGDRVRITQNGFTQDKKHRLNNGAIYDVREIHADGTIEFANGWKVGQHFGHLAHGYVTTSHASQGKTVDVVLIAQSAQSLGASSLEQFYVSASRAREQIAIYTDDRDGLKGAIARSGKRLSATELIENASQKDGTTDSTLSNVPMRIEEAVRRERSERNNLPESTLSATSSRSPGKHHGEKTNHVERIRTRQYRQVLGRRHRSLERRKEHVQHHGY